VISLVGLEDLGRWTCRLLVFESFTSCLTVIYMQSVVLELGLQRMQEHPLTFWFVKNLGNSRKIWAKNL